MGKSLNKHEQGIEFLGRGFVLLDRSLYWPSMNVLLIADMHIGKATHFNDSGLPVPHQVEDRNLLRCRQLIDHFTPEAVYFMGDLFHSQSNIANDLLAAWLDDIKEVEFTLIEGNHDKSNSGSRALLQCSSSIDIDGLKLVHEPLDTGVPHICGHIHPAVKLKGKGRQRLRVPACIIDGSQMVLPAFGEFTGTHTVTMLPGMKAIPCL